MTPTVSRPSPDRFPHRSTRETVACSMPQPILVIELEILGRLRQLRERQKSLRSEPRMTAKEGGLVQNLSIGHDDFDTIPILSCSGECGGQSSIR